MLFNDHSPIYGATAAGGDHHVNTAASALAGHYNGDGKMREDSDAAQARVFAVMLRAEIEAVSRRVEDAERYAHTASRMGDTRGKLWHNEEARSQKKVLYELHRQHDALLDRFPIIAQAAPSI